MLKLAATIFIVMMTFYLYGYPSLALAETQADHKHRFYCAGDHSFVEEGCTETYCYRNYYECSMICSCGMATIGIHDESFNKHSFCPVSATKSICTYCSYYIGY